MEYQLEGSSYYRVVVSKRDMTDAVPQLEATVQTSSEDLFKRALSQSFDAKIEFDRVVQAKKGAKLAWRNLAPHISMNSAPIIASTTGFGLLSAAGDLVPFLMPSRWFQAKQAKQQAEAEKDAFILLRSDVGNSVVNLCLSYQADIESLQQIQQTKDLTADLVGEILTQERLGRFFPGTSNDLLAVHNSLEQMILAMKRGLISDRNAIAIAAGFYNPYAIDKVDLSLNSDIKNPATINYDELVQDVYDHSFELKQIDHIVQSYRHALKARMFNWLDPEGDYTGALGIGTPVYIGIGKYQVKEWEDRREQLKALLLQKVATTYNDRQLAINLFQKSTEGLEIQNNRISRLKTQMNSSQNFDPVGFLLAIRDLATSQLQVISAKYTFYQTQEQLDRARMAGHYQGIPYDTGREIRDVH